MTANIVTPRFLRLSLQVLCRGSGGDERGLFFQGKILLVVLSVGGMSADRFEVGKAEKPSALAFPLLQVSGALQSDLAILENRVGFIFIRRKGDLS